MVCPTCLQSEFETIEPGQFRCTHQILVDVVPPGAGGNTVLVPIPIYRSCDTVFDEAGGRAAETRAMDAAAKAERRRKNRETRRKQITEKIDGLEEQFRQWLLSVTEVEERLVIAATHLTVETPRATWEKRRRTWLIPPRLLWDVFSDLPNHEVVHAFFAGVFGTDRSRSAPVDAEALARWFRDRAAADDIPPEDQYVATSQRRTWWSGTVKEVRSRPVAGWKLSDGYVLAEPDKKGKLATMPYWDVFDLIEMGAQLRVRSPPAALLYEWNNAQADLLSLRESR